MASTVRVAHIPSEQTTPRTTFEHALAMLTDCALSAWHPILFSSPAPWERLPCTPTTQRHHAKAFNRMLHTHF